MLSLDSLKKNIYACCIIASFFVLVIVVNAQESVGNVPEDTIDVTEEVENSFLNDEEVEIAYGETDMEADGSEVEVGDDEEFNESELDSEQFSKPFVAYTFKPSRIRKTVSVQKESVFFEIDSKAKHSCRSEEFVISVSDTGVVAQDLFVDFNGNSSFLGDITIQNVPSGFDMYFLKNRQSSVSVTTQTESVGFVIEKKHNAQKGSFNVLFTFTQNGFRESVTTCQINVVNM